MRSKIINSNNVQEFQELLDRALLQYKVKDVKFNVSRSFLPETTYGEYIEVYYALLLLED